MASILSCVDMNYSVIESRSGKPTLIADGKAIHSRFDPEKEAQRAAGVVPEGIAVVVLAGLGLGYVARALLRFAPNRRLIIVESDPEVLELADRNTNIRKILDNPAVSLMVGGSPADISELMRGGPAGASIYYMDWKPSVATDPEWYAELKDSVEETIRRREVNARTLDRFGPLWVRNLAANVSSICRAASLAPWKDAFRDVPALILAGGPSLEEILPFLPELQKSHLLIAVDTALPAVLRSNTMPDIIAAVDPQYWNTRHLDRCTEGASDALVLAESATHPAVFRKLRGRPWLTRTRFPLGTLLEDAAGIEGELKAGGSVATAAWDLARHLGCSPMTIAGLDLGFPGGRTHYSGSLSRELPLKSAARVTPAENAFYHALHDAGTRPVESAGGGSILSDARMDIYAAWFSESVTGLEDRQPSTVGSEGRKIPGMGIVSIPDLKLRSSRRPEINKVLNKVKEVSITETGSVDVLTQIRQVLISLNELEDSSREGIKIALKAKERLKKGKNPQELLNRLDLIDHRILAGEGRDLISFLIQPIILDITSATNENVSDPLENSLRLYGEMAESAQYHIRYLQNAISRQLNR